MFSNEGRKCVWTQILLRELVELDILDKREKEVAEVGSKELQSSWEVRFIEICQLIVHLFCFQLNCERDCWWQVAAVKGNYGKNLIVSSWRLEQRGQDEFSQEKGDLQKPKKRKMLK